MADDTKNYPGGLSAYTRLREMREAAQGDYEKGTITGDLPTVAALAIAEELAGLSYILDGIRYQTRGK